MMSCASFWFKPSNVGARITIATSSVLTIIAYRLVLASLLPRLPYMTHMDFFAVGCTLIVFLVLTAIVMTSFFNERKDGSLVRKIDLCGRLFFPSAFFALLGWFVLS